ncbi:MAG: gamma-glutamyl-gamma-aminobutyrate hydrolase family protein [Spirochaetota bacterium]
MKRIGVSACFFHHDPQRAIFKGKRLVYFEESMLQWIQKSGNIPVLIPSPYLGISLNSYIQEIDGLVLQGGSDVSPLSYGEEALRPEWRGDKFRDEYEIALVQACMQENKPILGVCRGLQLLNVALGGTLYQDIETQLEGTLQHRNWDMYDTNYHEIEFCEGSELSRIYPQIESSTIISIHHQAIKDLGKGLLVEAVSKEDKVIEAIRLDSADNFVYAVQWHPEFQKDDDTSLLSADRLFTHFLQQIQKDIV